MSDESNAHLREASSVKTPTVFVTDAAAESARIADTLRNAGYAVVDVPLSMLVARAQVQRPNVVLVDVDSPNALHEIGRLRKIPGGGAIDFVYFGTGVGDIRNADDAISNEGSAYFARPVDVGALVRRVESLTGGPTLRPEVRPSTPPPALPQPRHGSVPPEISSAPSLPAPGLRSAGPPLPMSSPSLADLVDQPRSLATFGVVSNELQQLLAEAEMRIDIAPQGDGPLPTPEEEIETVLPADVLASLDEPIGADEDEEHEVRVNSGPGAEGTGAHAKGTTSGGSRHTTASGARTPHTHERRIGGSDHPVKPSLRRPSDPPAQSGSATRPGSVKAAVAPAVSPPQSVPPSPASTRGAPMSTTTPSETRPDLARPDSVTIATRDLVIPTPASAGRIPLAPPVERPPTAAPATILPRPTDARRFVANAIAERLSGALCFEHEGVVRRLVVRDGDLVTAASGVEQESLVSFLGTRGELPRDEVERLNGKIPPQGRHAGAALIAHGFLSQDQLWSVLRAHAEWIATTILRLTGGTAQLEAESPGRLRSEPSVFAACTGAEIFVELVRRAVAPDEAVGALGGENCRIGDGPKPSLLGECSLPPAELELVSRARGGTLGDLLGRGADPEIAAVVHALALLGVLDVVPAAEPSRGALSSSASVEAAALDDEAIRARIRARLELVDEGDYFAILGVARDATSYEVRRAFIELRRAFEPTRILSPRLVDLAEDVRKIVAVLEEAYEILRDGARRERYRKAIDARP